MTFLAPGFLWGAIAVALGIVALHFIVTRLPRASVLPTARFVPDSPASATARNARPSDILLMLLRVLLVLAAGAALAKPVMQPSRRANGRIILMDASRSVASVAEAADSVRTLYRVGDVVVVFDSTTRPLGPSARDSLGVVHRANVAGNLSAAFIAALREGNSLRGRVDSLELAIVSPLLAEERDAATDSIRRLWPGRARIVRIAAKTDSSSAGNGDIALRSDATDPVGVAVSLVANRRRPSARIVRNAALDAQDSAWMASGNNVVVLWPSIEKPRLAAPRSSADQSGGLVASELRLVATFDRRWRFPADSLRDTRVTARWADGEPAAVEKRMGHGCLRSVAIPVPVAGDLVIRPEFVRLVDLLTAPCDETGSTAPLASAATASIAGRGRLAPSDAFAMREDIGSPLAQWLLGIALAAALVELVVRGRGASVKSPTASEAAA